MRETSYEDEDGRKWAVRLPDGSLDVEASTGIPIGPPSLEDLGLPKEIEVELHNALFTAKIFTPEDIKKRRQTVVDILKRIYKLDAEKIYVHYLNWEGRQI